MIQTSELKFFSVILKTGSLSAAARELGLTPPSVSKRLAQMEERLGVQLVNRTTRRLSLTDEGELYRTNALRILAELEEMERLVSSNHSAPKGLLRINAPLGFGRVYITPLISKFVKLYPEMEVQLQLTDHPLNLVDQAFDIGIRFGLLPDTRLIARKIALNRRLLCAAPSYLKKYGVPKVPHDLTRHNCIILRQNDTAYGTWQFTRGRNTESIKIRGTLSSNDGEVTLNWALDGHGVTLRAEWDIAKYLRSGRLQLVMEEYAAPPADIFAVYPERHHTSAKVRAFIEFLATSFNQKANGAAHKSDVW